MVCVELSDGPHQLAFCLDWGGFLKRHKRVWTEEQKKAVGDRLKAGRLAKQSQTAVAELPRLEVSPEVQAVIDTMTPERKAKLAAILSRQWQRDASEDKATREALERHEAQKKGIPPLESKPEVVAVDLGPLPEPPPPPKAVLVMEVPFKVPFRLTGSQSGLMISELSLCLCGEQRLKWHPVCLKVKVNG